MTNLSVDLYSAEHYDAAAAFLSKMAEIERNAPKLATSCGDTAPASPAQQLVAGTAGNDAAPPAEKQTEKKTRGKKEAPAPEPAVAAPQGTPTPAAAVSSANPEPGTAPKHSHDDIRVLVGKLTEGGKRNDAITLIRSYKAGDKAINAVAEIPESLLDEIHGKLNKMLGAGGE